MSIMDAPGDVLCAAERAVSNLKEQSEKTERDAEALREKAGPEAVKAWTFIDTRKAPRPHPPSRCRSCSHCRSAKVAASARLGLMDAAAAGEMQAHVGISASLRSLSANYICRIF